MTRVGVQTRPDEVADRPLTIGQRIDKSYGELSPQEQRAADFILDHLTDLAIYSGTELAHRSGVSKATVSRLFRRLGFENAQEVREHARSLRSSGVPVGGATPGASADLSAHLVREVENLRRCLDSLGPERLEQAISLLVNSRSVVVVGMRNSFAPALHLREQLAQARTGVLLAPQPGQTIAEEFADRDARDVAVVFGFRRRPAGFARLVQGIAARGVSVLLIGDASARRYAEFAQLWLECPIDSVTPLDSYASAMSLVNVLASGALAARPRDARTRIAAINTLYDAFGELE
ncbi:MurR/RpiR family transcriptional regulator [Herbiconiux sp. KACC 21604]|uniref:MurR/RpiR family transcriptional regulator n=1 Tax=unclassified Herbiconiux TaxID=2618217 RepID=UPI0020A43F12|nr:MurR/RpiR family transcriptional regulator [Herbiconiux sp. SALV-R1]WPO85078.1 MurR/RpiR family transcriptional regulator [Herbiconiux sp. KACC 21604]